MNENDLQLRTAWKIYSLKIAQYIDFDSKLLAPVVYIAKLVKTTYSVDRQWRLESIHTLRFESIHTLLSR